MLNALSNRLEDVLAAGVLVGPPYPVHDILTRDNFVNDLLGEANKEHLGQVWLAERTDLWRRVLTWLVAIWEGDASLRNEVARSVAATIRASSAETASEIGLLEVISTMARTGDVTSLDIIANPIFGQFLPAALQTELGIRFIQACTNRDALISVLRRICSLHATREWAPRLATAIRATLDSGTAEEIAMMHFNDDSGNVPQASLATAWENMTGGASSAAGKAFLQALKAGQGLQEARRQAERVGRAPK